MSTELWTALGGAMISFLIGWGVMRAKQLEFDRRVSLLERQSSKQLEFIHSLRDVYVSYQHFNEIMQTIREGHRELKEDVKKVLDLLASRV